MLESASLYTFEIDEPEIALAQILQQLQEKLVLRKNTAAILQCDPEFIDSGIVAQLCAMLDFPIVGGTSAAQGTNDARGDLMLSLLVLTSDDVHFVATHTTGLAQDLFGATERSLNAALKQSDLPLRLVLTFPPIIDDYAGDWYVEAFQRVCGRVAIFGSLAVDDAITVYNRCASVYNGKILTNEMSYLLVYGNVHPRFFVASVQNQSGADEQGIITKSEGNLVHAINDTTAIKYFEESGLAKNGVLREGIDFVPFLMSLPGAQGPDALPFVRAVIRFDENGSAVCRGVMYEGATFTIGSNVSTDVLNATRDMIEQVNAQETPQALLLFSCIVRRLSVGANALMELDTVQQTLRPDIPYMISYSGGEIAPVSADCDGATNRFHNFTFIGCLL